MSKNYVRRNENFWCKWIAHSWEKFEDSLWGEAKYEKYKCKRCKSTVDINASSTNENDQSLPARW